MAGHTEGELFFQGLWIWQGIQKVHTLNNLWRALLFPRVLDMATLGNVMDMATLFPMVLDMAILFRMVLDMATLGNVLDMATLFPMVLHMATLGNVLDIATLFPMVLDIATLFNVLDMAWHTEGEHFFQGFWMWQVIQKVNTRSPNKI